MSLIVVNVAVLAVFKMVTVVSADVAVILRPNALSSQIVPAGDSDTRCVRLGAQFVNIVQLPSTRRGSGREPVV